MSQRELGSSCRTIFRHVWFSVGVSRGHQKQGFSLDLVATRLPQLDVASFRFALAFTAERGDIHLLSGTIESWELLGDGRFLFPIDAQAKSGLIKDINVADFDLLNDQASTPQLLRASKPMYGLAATIPPPTCLTGGTNAGGEHADILHSLTRLLGNHTLRFTHVAIGLDVMDEYPGTDGLFRRYISETLRTNSRLLSCRSRRSPNAGQDFASTIPRGGTSNERRSH